MADPSSRKSSQWARLVGFFASFGLAVAVMGLLLLLTLFGTLEMTGLGLRAAVSKYFHSWFVMAFDWLPMPGGIPLMGVLFVNMLVGSVIKARKDPKRIGILISHLSIMFLLVAGLVTHGLKEEGVMQLYEGQSSNEVQAYREWEIEIEELPALGADGQIPDRTGLKIPLSQFDDLGGVGDRRIFHSAKLPFEIELSHYRKNSDVARNEAQKIELQKLDAFPSKDETRQNLPGVDFKGLAADGSVIEEDFLWGGTTAGPVFEHEGRTYSVRLQKKRWTIPYAVYLDDFVVRYHDGTTKPREFSSYVYQSDPEASDEAATEGERFHIHMNYPMRDEGWVLYQESWGPSGAAPDVPQYTQLAVSRNPSDQWPLWCTVGSCVGLLIHFCTKLYAFLGRQSRLRARAKEKSSPSPADAEELASN